MKKTYFNLLFLFFLNLVNAQSSYFKVRESQKFVDQKSKTEVQAVHTTASNETIIARSSNKNLIFEVFDDATKMIFNLNIEIPKKEDIVGELFYNNQLKIFSVNKVSKTQRIINCHILDQKSKKYRKIELLSTNVEKKQSLFSGQNKRQTNIAISPNESYLAIATDNIKKHANSYLIHVFDAKSLELLYSKNYYTNKEKFFKSNDMIIDNDGIIFCLGKEYNEGRREKKNAKANYSFVLNKIYEAHVEVKKIDLDENEHIESLRIVPKENTLNLIGFFSEKNTSSIKGLTQIKIDPASLNILNKNNFDLPQEVYEGIYGNRKASKKSKKELNSFYIDHFLEDGLGNTYILAEEFFITQTYVSQGMNGGYWVTTYHYDDILILKLNSEGKLEWGRSIFKRSSIPSYNAFMINNRLHVLLNSGKNLTEKKDGRIKASKGWFESSSLYDFIYDINGKVTHEKIQDNKNKTVYIPYLGSYIGNKFIMYNHSKNNKRLMILEKK